METSAQHIEKSSRLAFVSLTEIDTGKRIREVFSGKGEGETLEELVDSITYFGGIIQPILLIEKDSMHGDIQHGYVPEHHDRPYLLGAGERRLRSARDAGLISVPAIIAVGWSMQDLFQAEFDENYNRLDFTVAEKKLALARTHRELKARAAKRGETWSIEQTAEATKKGRGTVWAAIHDAKAIEDDPSLKEVKTGKELRAKVRRTKRREKLAKIAAAHELASILETEETVFKRLQDSYNVEDFFSHAFHRKANLIEFDPDYGFGLKDKRKNFALSGSERTDEYVPKDPKEIMDFANKVIERCQDELTTADAWFLLWCDMQWVSEMRELLNKHGFVCNPYNYFVWCKPNGQTRQPLYNRANCTELLLYGRKGRPFFQEETQLHGKGQGQKNWYLHSVTQREDRHPTEKPIPLYELLFDQHLFKGAHIIVPCLGSGNTIFAGENLGITAEGTELSYTFRNDFIHRATFGGPKWEPSS